MRLLICVLIVCTFFVIGSSGEADYLNPGVLEYMESLGWVFILSAGIIRLLGRFF
jgi:hypothetical protein